LSKGSSELLKNNEKNEKNAKKINDRTLVVKINQCPQNHPCPSITVCSTGALSQKGHEAPSVDMLKCIKCGKCVKYCPMHALVLE